MFACSKLEEKMKRKMVKVGWYGNTLVPNEEARVEGIPSQGQETKPRRTTAKAARELANETCVGGLRSPWRAASALHLAAGVGAKVKEALRQALTEHPALATAVDGDKLFDPDTPEQKAGVERARALVAEALGVEHPQPMGRSTAWQPHLVQAWVAAANDLDIDLARWLLEGAPLGVREDIPARGVFPVVEPSVANEVLEEIFTADEPRTNYKSYEEAFTHVAPELERLRQAGYVEVLGSWSEVTARFGRSVVVSKLAAILKPRADGSLKVRLVIDYRRSGVNAHVRTPERVVLPRIKDALDDAVYLMSQDGGSGRISMMVLDFKDAFHTIPVAPRDVDLQVFMSSPGVFEVFNTTVFGSKASPLIWGRFAAFLMRSGQAMFSPEELLLECYVDDPLVLLVGDESTRQENAALLLLWWRVLGPGISWGKIEAGRSVNWIGATLSFPEGEEDVVEASLPQAFADDLLADVCKQMTKPMVEVDDLRRLAGKGSWAAGVGPTLRNFLQPLGKVVGDAARAEASAPASAKQKEARRRKGKSSSAFVATRRVMTSLCWLRALLSKEHRSAIKRQINWRIDLAAPTLVITCDASPWGLGAVLSTPEGFPLAWLASDVTQDDADRLGLKWGESSGQAVLEALAVLVAVRTWASHWTGAKARVHVRSDSQSALGALGKLSSPVPAMNAIAREVAVDVATSDYGLEPVSWGHVAGVLNDWADALSRLHAPEPKTVPAVLAAFDMEKVPPRGAAWWRASRGTGVLLEKARPNRGKRRRLVQQGE